MSFCSIRLIAPIVRDHGIDYERCKFQDKLNDGSLTLERTEVLFLCLLLLFLFSRDLLLLPPPLPAMDSQDRVS